MLFKVICELGLECCEIVWFLFVVCLTIGNQQFPENEDAAIQTAVRIGMKAAEEFCKQMEEREK